MVAMTDDEERELKVAVTQADLRLKGRQAFWETPRNLFLIIGTITAATAAIAGFAGYKIGQQPAAAPPVQIIFQPGSTVAAPAPVATPPSATAGKK